MQNNHPIHSIYKATEGEGVFIGKAQVFVRYQGCAIGCLNCDSKETWNFTEGLNLSTKEVIEKIESFYNFKNLNGCFKNVSITGGDPLHPKIAPKVLELIIELKKLNYKINIEAAGSRIDESIFQLVDYISFDFKTPSTGVKTPLNNISNLIKNYPNKFQIKAVIFDRFDFETTLDAYLKTKFDENSINFWVLTPCYNPNEMFPMERFQNILKWNEEIGGPFRVIGQQHKWIFGPNVKDV